MQDRGDVGTVVRELRVSEMREEDDDNSTREVDDGAQVRNGRGTAPR
jgi:hypothetical protein